MNPSSSVDGFFQTVPVLGNQARDDASVQRVMKYILGSSKNAFGQPQSSRLMVSEGWKKLQEFGFRKGLVSFSYERETIPSASVVKSLRALLFEASGAMTSCPNSMQDGAARLLQSHLRGSKLDPTRRRVFQNAFNHLISRDPKHAWTSGQWMTERTGGSDVSQTETIATYDPLPAENSQLRDIDDGIPLGPWRVDGFKWFSSATDSNMTILLAKTAKGGLSAFFAPMRRYNKSLVSDATGTRGGTELNGVHISRLKRKMGTKPLPTAELELRGMRAWLIGEEGQGIREVSTILTVTRVGSATGALGYVSRGLAIAKAFTLVREIGAGRGRRISLAESSLHMHTLADMTIEYHGLMLLAFFSSYLMGYENQPSSTTTITAPTPALSLVAPLHHHVTPLLRVLTSVTKAYVTKHAVPLLHACMECLGGVGYLENSETEHLNVARLFRDACVNPIWEGTTDVLAADAVRALRHPRDGPASLEALDRLFLLPLDSSLQQQRQQQQQDAKPPIVQGVLAAVADRWTALRARIVVGTTAGEQQQQQHQADPLLADARDVVWQLAEMVCTVLLLVDAQDADTPQAWEGFRRWTGMRKNGGAVPATIVGEMMAVAGGSSSSSGSSSGDSGLRMNQEIVFGPGGVPMAAAAAAEAAKL